MMDCLVLGDSIAYGISLQVPQCQSETKIGINSKNFVNELYTRKVADRTIISLGSNDKGIDPKKELFKLRQQIDGKVVWILPYSIHRIEVLDIIKEFGDSYVDLKNYDISKDKVHPKSYKEIAKDCFKH